MKIRVSKIIELLVLLYVILNATYIFPFFDVQVPELFYSMARIVPIITAAYCLLNRNVYSQIYHYVKFINWFVAVWFLFFVLEIIYSINLYGENITFERILSNYWCFVYILLVYPIVYLLYLYKDGFLKKLASIIVFDTFLRGTASFVESVSGISISAFLSTKMSSARIGINRLFCNVFTPLVLDLKIVKDIDNRYMKFFPSFTTIFLLIYIIFIDQSRSKLVGIVAVIGIWIYAGIDSKNSFSGKKKVIYIVGMIMFVICLTTFGVIESIFDSFSTTGENAASTINRVYSVKYYLSEMKGKEALGMGLLYDDTIYGSGSSTLYHILRNPDIQLGRAAYFEDFGIIGQYFNYGIIGVMLFLFFFLRIVKIVCNCKYTSKYYMLLILCVHSVIDSFMPISIFTNTNMILVPFYFAIFEFYNIEARIKKE